MSRTYYRPYELLIESCKESKERVGEQKEIEKNAEHEAIDADEAWEQSFKGAEKVDKDVEEAGDKATMAEEIAKDAKELARIAIHILTNTAKDDPTYANKLTRANKAMKDAKKAQAIAEKARIKAREADERWDEFQALMARKQLRVDNAYDRWQTAKEDLAKIQVIFQEAHQEVGVAEAKEESTTSAKKRPRIY
jgi:hypothetical protein